MRAATAGTYSKRVRDPSTIEAAAAASYIATTDGASKRLTTTSTSITVLRYSRTPIHFPGHMTPST